MGCETRCAISRPSVVGTVHPGAFTLRDFPTSSTIRDFSVAFVLRNGLPQNPTFRLSPNFTSFLPSQNSNHHVENHHRRFHFNYFYVVLTYNNHVRQSSSTSNWRKGKGKGWPRGQEAEHFFINQGWTSVPRWSYRTLPSFGKIHHPHGSRSTGLPCGCLGIPLR